MGPWPVVALVLALVACGGRARFRPLDHDGGADAGPDAAPDGGCQDGDGDGHEDEGCGGRDCDDADPAVHPNASDPGEWTLERADQLGWAIAPAIVVDAEAVPHVLFEDRAAGAVVHAVRTGEEAWEREVVEEGGHGPAAALDGDGQIHVLFVSPGPPGVVRHGIRGGPGWTVTTFEMEGEVIGAPVAASDRGEIVAAVPHRALETTGVRFMRWTGDAWSLESLVSSGVAPGRQDGPLALAVGRDGEVGVAFTRDDWTYLFELVDGEWVRLPAPERARRVALARGSSGWLLAYEPHDAAALALAREADGWAQEIVDDRHRSGRALAIAADEQGAAHLLYFADERFDVRYATDRHGGWLRVPIDRSGEPHVAIAADATGALHLAYATTDSDLHWARHVPGDGIDQDCDGLADDGR